MRRKDTKSKYWAMFFAVAALTACSSSKPDSPSQQPPDEQPVVTDERTDLVLTWIDEGGGHVASSVAEVPEDHRGSVRVQDPKIPPEERDPAWVFIADLSRKVAGKYKVKAVSRAQFEEQRHPQAEAPGAPAPNPKRDEDRAGQPAAPAAPIVMYATKTCPVCQKARRWLLDTGIRFIEKDVDSDPAAVAELRSKAQAQGVPTDGVPVFDVRGKLVPGFDKKVILSLLSGSQSSGLSAPTMTI